MKIFILQATSQAQKNNNTSFTGLDGNPIPLVTKKKATVPVVFNEVAPAIVETLKKKGPININNLSVSEHNQLENIQRVAEKKGLSGFQVYKQDDNSFIVTGEKDGKIYAAAPQSNALKNGFFALIGSLVVFFSAHQLSKKDDSQTPAALKQSTVGL